MLRFIKFATILIATCLFSLSSLAAEMPGESSLENVSSEIPIGRLIIKFKDDYKVRVDESGTLKSPETELDFVVNAIASKSGKSIERLMIRSQEEIDLERQFLEGDKSASLPDLNSYYQVAVDDYAAAKEIINSIKNHPAVEKAYIRPKSYPASDIPPTTPDFTSEQGYLNPAPDGVDAYYAWNVPGGNGSNVRVIDIEGDWNFDHEDFGDNIDTLLYGIPVTLPGWSSHGSCVIGIIAADSNDYGITGIAHEAMVSTVSIGYIGVAAAIDYAAAELSPGDIMLIELNTPGPRYDFSWQPDQAGYVPEEYFDETFDVVQLASAKGVIVCAVAGNGADNLDDPIYENRFNPAYRDSRAIIVGAGAPPSGNWGQDRSRLYFSNYGSRIDLQGWGKEVVASGYGVLFNPDNDYRQHYTDRFSGTSSAAAMVTGAAASLQSAYIEEFGQPMNPDDLRNLLKISGTLQPNPSENIGSRPDLKLALQSMSPPSNVRTDPSYVQASVPEGQSGSNNILILNENPDRTIDFEITVIDTIEGQTENGWLTVSPASGTIGPNSGDFLNFQFDCTELPGSLHPYKANVIIDVDLNPGNDTLLVPVFLECRCNDTSYTILDSDYGEINYNWIDISQAGIAIDLDEFENSEVPEGRLDDGTAGPYPIGFSFNFYGTFFNQVNICTNGAISFVEEDLTINGYFDDIYFPAPGFDAFLSPFWNDLTLDTSENGNGTVYYYTSPQADSFIVSYERIANLNPPGDTMISFQLILTDQGNIRYQYKEIGFSGAQTTASVGISLTQDCRYIRFFDIFLPTQTMPHELRAVEFVPNYEITYLRGDTNGDFLVNVSDAVYLINYIFISGPEPLPLESAEVNCDGEVNVSDAVWIINYIFTGGYAPGDTNGDGIPDC